MGQTAAAGDWVREQRERTAKELKRGGYIAYDECGQALLTEKGKRRAAARLDKMPLGDDLLLEIAVCEAYSVTARI